MMRFGRESAWIGIYILVLVCGNWSCASPSLGGDSGVNCSTCTDVDVDTDTIDTETHEMNWADWPPVEGQAGFKIYWTIDGKTPTAANCEQADLGQIKGELLHPVVDFETWTDDRLNKQCVEQEMIVQMEAGLAPGRYRYRILLFRMDDQPFVYKPEGETVLIAGETVTLTVVNITTAQEDGAQKDRAQKNGDQTQEVILQTSFPQKVKTDLAQKLTVHVTPL